MGFLMPTSTRSWPRCHGIDHNDIGDAAKAVGLSANHCVSECPEIRLSDLGV